MSNSTQTQPTSAEEYRRLRDKAREAEGEPVTMKKTGAVFILRRANMDAMVMFGQLPQSLIAEGMEQWRKDGKVPDIEDVKIEDVTDEQAADGLIFMREMVRQAFVRPRLVVGATGPDELDPMDLDAEDFTQVFEYTTGVGSTLRNFRSGQRRKAAAPKSRRKVLRDKAERVPAG